MAPDLRRLSRAGLLSECTGLTGFTAERPSALIVAIPLVAIITPVAAITLITSVALTAVVVPFAIVRSPTIATV
jgi:hypothetical protein